MLFLFVEIFFFFKQKTAYEMRISDWSSDVCSSDLGQGAEGDGPRAGRQRRMAGLREVHPRTQPRDGEAQRLTASAGLHRIAEAGTAEQRGEFEIGRASCRGRVCQYV